MRQHVLGWWTLELWFWRSILLLWCFCLELGGMKEWTSTRVVAMVAVTKSFLVGAKSGHTKPGQKSCTSHLSACYLGSESLSIQWH